MILLIDNFDSFTYNLVQYFGELGEDIVVRRNNAITVKEIEDLRPDQIVISPGPCTPKEAGVSNDAIRKFSGKIPILGVCLGHQCIGHVFGGRVVRAKRIMHGKISEIKHEGDRLFRGVGSPFQATRYHSLVVEKKSFPRVLGILAVSEDGEIMALRHRTHPTWGVQFHPESIMTRDGKTILKNFMELSRK
ncbi:MAG: aminodeoxychorismate/anthranilate synthase component II [Candidatus Omnitrophica bacterium]|nr:aminodeoxychorismate/anthranilate synthase component II [Candidatus Omnitrophota bacterium]